MSKIIAPMDMARVSWLHISASLKCTLYIINVYIFAAMRDIAIKDLNLIMILFLLSALIALCIYYLLM